MGERLNLVDRYDLTCVKDELESLILKQYNNEICPIKKILHSHREQIDGLGETILMISKEIEINKDKASEYMVKTNFDKIKIDNLLFDRTKRLLEKINILEDKILYNNKINENRILLLSLINLFIICVWSF